MKFSCLAILLIVIQQSHTTYGALENNPVVVTCPNQFNNTSKLPVRFIDPNHNANEKHQQQFLCNEEKEWIKQKDIKLKKQWIDYLNNLKLTNFDVEKTVSNKNLRFPRIGIASSGGGFRAMLNGAGVINALDRRDNEAWAKKSGGIWQLSSYFIGLSGSSWLASGLLAYDFPTPKEYVTKHINLSKHTFSPGIKESG
eukprot:Pgem_evm1s7676